MHKQHIATFSIMDHIHIYTQQIKETKHNVLLGQFLRCCDLWTEQGYLLFKG